MTQGLGLYPTPNHAASASQSFRQASGTYAGMDRARPEPEKSAAGAVQSGASMGVAGAKLGSIIGGDGISGTAAPAGEASANMALQDVSTSYSGGKWGAIAGVGVGLGSYLMS